MRNESKLKLTVLVLCCFRYYGVALINAMIAAMLHTARRYDIEAIPPLGAEHADSIH